MLSFVDDRQRKTLMAQLISAIAIIFMALFSFDSYMDGHTLHALILIIIIALIAVNLLWMNKSQNPDAAHLVIIVLLGSFCLYLFYSGGISGTGPLWSFVFVTVAVFMGGMRFGVLAVVLLFAAVLLPALFIQSGTYGGFYSSDFMKRFIGVYAALFIIMLINEYLRESTLRHLVKTNQHLDLLFRTDDLTGLFNRRHIMEHLSYEMLRLQRKGSPFSVIIFDIDHFKQVNDKYGHLCGDYVLRTISLIAKEVLRTLDIIARIGGEEFLILLPETPLAGAGLVGERLKKAIEDYQFHYEGLEFKVTISLGVSEATGDSQLEELLQKVDENLYKAKQAGRNRMIAI